MTDFDPIAYLQQDEDKPFDPVAYLSQPDHARYDPSAGDATLQVGPFDTGIRIPEWANRGLAGAGKAIVDLGRGAEQYLGLESRGDVAESRRLDAPLMATTAGKLGNVGGDLAVGLGSMLIPGAGTINGAARIGAAIGALQPSTSTDETLANTAGGGLAALGGTLVGKGISAVAGKALGKASDAVAENAALGKAHELGYVVPPSTSNPTIGNKLLEGFAGKLTTAQAASIKNQSVTDNLVRAEFGLPEGAPLLPETMETVRAEAGKTYGKIASLGDIDFGPEYEKDLAGLSAMSSKVSSKLPNLKLSGADQINDLVESLKPEGGTMDGETAVLLSRQLRAEASQQGALASRTGDPQAQNLSKAYRGAAEAVEDAVERHLNKIGQPELADEWDQARRTIAKSYDVQKSMDGAGHVDATKLGKMLLKGRPLSDNLEAAAQFANKFPKAARAINESMPGISPLDMYAGMGIDAATGNHVGMALGPARMAVRSALLRSPGQALGTPGFGLNLAGKLGQAASNVPELVGYTEVPNAGAKLNDVVQSANHQ